jgi:hypothetical protein
MPVTTPFPERDAEELLTLSEVAEILRVPINTLRWWRQIGTGPEFFKIAPTWSPPSVTCGGASASSGGASVASRPVLT